MTEAHELPLQADASIADVASPEVGPKGTATLRSRHSPLARPERQVAALEALDLGGFRFGGDFSDAVGECSAAGLRASGIEIFQINLGKLCNMTCRHCHVDAGPDRWDEVMDRETVDACLRALDRTDAHTVDLTGGAPELNPSFRYLVEQCVDRGKRVIDRCNLTVLLLPRNRGLAEWMAEHGVEVVCSLPHFRRRNTDAQRGSGTFMRSIDALRLLNDAGYGHGDPRRVLTVVMNPVGAFLAGDQTALEREWKHSLAVRHDVRFDRLITLNNMPIARYLEWLEESNNLERYMETLVNAFNPATVAGLMCRSTLSVSWDGRVFDCDFNQMLDLESSPLGGGPARVTALDPDSLAGRPIVTGRHCFGCTAGAGSSCGGAIDEF